MIEIRETREFSTWLDKVRDQQAVARIQVRIRRLSLGNAGDVKAVGEGISEMRIDYGPGYRVYFKVRGQELIVLLCGGDKTSQQADIVHTKRLAKELD
jgi:putative addiction module killer protein